MLNHHPVSKIPAFLEVLADKANKHRPVQVTHTHTRTHITNPGV